MDECFRIPSSSVGQGLTLPWLSSFSALTYYDPKDWVFPRDSNGRGTWCAGVLSHTASHREARSPTPLALFLPFLCLTPFPAPQQATAEAFPETYSPPVLLPSHLPRSRSQRRSRHRPGLLRVDQLCRSWRVQLHPLHPSPPSFTLTIPFIPLHFLTGPQQVPALCPSARPTASCAAYKLSQPFGSLPVCPPFPIPSAAAGTGPVSFGSINSVGLGSSYGVAPRAFLAMYKVAWYSAAYGGQVISEADVVAAVDTAVADGVDVLLLSLGGMDTSETYVTDLPYLDTHLAGVVVVKAAGNFGPPPFHPSLYRAISNFSPFFLTVGASSISCRYNVSLTLGNGTVLYGNGFGGASMGANTPLIDPAKIPAAGYDASTAKYCKYSSLSTTWVAWRMVVCLYGGGVSNDEKAAEVACGKGLVVLIVNVMPADEASVTRYKTFSVMTLFPPNDAILNEYLLSA
ncbi:unnamed protein product, partial [Closterium sp. NIES-53]